jgi:hypothetical protein
VALREVTVDAHQLERDEVQAAALEASDHLADEVTLDAVRLDQDEGAFEAHGAPV